MTDEQEPEKVLSNNSTTEPITDLASKELAPFWLSALIDSADDAIISKTLDGIITSWNKGAERIFGYKADEIIGKPVTILIPAEQSNEEPIIIRRIKKGERVEHYETVRMTKDGRLVDISLTVSPIKDVDGNIIGASKIVREITDLKRAQKALRASEERYRTLFNSIDEGFCVIQMMFDDNMKPFDYRFLELNPTFIQQTGLTEAAPGKTMRELIPNHDDSWFEIYGKVALTNEPIRFENYAEVLNSWFDLYAFPVGEPEDYKVAVIFNNITERKRAEQEKLRLLKQLELERSHLQYLFTKAPAFVATLQGPDHIFEMTNPAYLQLIGHRKVVGKPLREALPEIEEQGFIELLDNVYKTGEAFIGRETAVQLQRNPDVATEERFVDFVFQPIFGDEEGNTISGIFVHGVDITEQVEARRNAESANRSKDEFLAMLSHELRTPLNAILGWSKIMAESRLDEAARKRALETIQRNARVQAELIEDILDVSRIISGKLKLEVAPIDLTPVVEAAIESILPAVQAKEIRFQRILDSGSSMISGDPNRLQQIIWNLLSNAVKFTPKGGLVQVRLERVNSYVEIIVTDNGIGIPSKALPYIFDRFRQADSATTRQHGGLGLGLAIVRHLVEMHGGTVEAESDGEDRGSIFTIKLPLIALRSPGIAQENEETSSNTDIPFKCTPELEGLHVLVVDDEEDGRRLVATVLEQCGAQVTEADSAADALQAIKELHPDILVSDVGMPGEDGYSLIKKVRELSPAEGGEIPAAALTAYARVEDRLKVLRAGFQIHLPKPVEPAELVAVVANLSGRHKLK